MNKLVLIGQLIFCVFPLLASTAGGIKTPAAPALSPEKHFHPMGKAPSEYTLKILEASRKTLPFSDKRDFDEEKKGFIAAPESWKILGDAGNVVWDMERYKFFLEGKDFPSVHPSLQRQSTLNMNFGLYEVMPGVYQVRGFDLANISFVRGDTAWIVFDPLTVEETEENALLGVIGAGRVAGGRTDARIRLVDQGRFALRVDQAHVDFPDPGAEIGEQDLDLLPPCTDQHFRRRFDGGGPALGPFPRERAERRQETDQ